MRRAIIADLNVGYRVTRWIAGGYYAGPTGSRRKGDAASHGPFNTALGGVLNEEFLTTLAILVPDKVASAKAARGTREIGR